MLHYYLIRLYFFNTELKATSVISCKRATTLKYFVFAGSKLIITKFSIFFFFLIIILKFVVELFLSAKIFYIVKYYYLYYYITIDIVKCNMVLYIVKMFWDVFDSKMSVMIYIYLLLLQKLCFFLYWTKWSIKATHAKA